MWWVCVVVWVGGVWGFVCERCVCGGGGWGECYMLKLRVLFSVRGCVPEILS